MKIKQAMNCRSFRVRLDTSASDINATGRSRLNAVEGSSVDGRARSRVQDTFASRVCWVDFVNYLGDFMIFSNRDIAIFASGAIVQRSR